MDKKEFDKLQQAGQLIKAGDYGRAKKILATMPHNPKAQQWLDRINEKEQSVIDAPTLQKTPQKPPKKQSNALVTIGMLLAGVIILVGIIGVAYHLAIVQTAYDSYIPRAQVVMAEFCQTLWDLPDGDCVTYAQRYFEVDREFSLIVQTCETFWTRGDAPQFGRCLRNIKYPADLLD